MIVPRVNSVDIMHVIKESNVEGICSSTVLTSLDNLLTILPSGVVSKKDMGYHSFVKRKMRLTSKLNE